MIKNISYISIASLAYFCAGDVFAAAEKAEKSAGLPQLDPTWYVSQAFGLVLMFVVLYALFSNRVIPDLTKTIEGRHNHVQGDLDMAEKLQREAQDVHDAYDAVMEEARQNASKLYGEIDKDVKEKTVKEYAAFQERILKDTQVAEARIDKTKKEIIAEVDQMTVGVVSQALGKITSIKAKDSDIQKSIEDIKKAA